jgi:hypothetical protein
MKRGETMKHYLSKKTILITCLTTLMILSTVNLTAAQGALTNETTEHQSSSSAPLQVQLLQPDPIQSIAPSPTPSDPTDQLPIASPSPLPLPSPSVEPILPITISPVPSVGDKEVPQSYGTVLFTKVVPKFSADEITTENATNILSGNKIPGVQASDWYALSTVKIMNFGLLESNQFSPNKPMPSKLGVSLVAKALGSAEPTEDTNSAANKIRNVDSGLSKVADNENLTRLEFVKFAVNALGLEIKSFENIDTLPFSDVSSLSDENRAYLWTAKAAGIIAGFPDGTFQPGRLISYAQCVTVLVRLLGYSPL